MATVILQYAGAALGTFLGGPIGGIIGRAAGAIAGNIFDQNLFASGTHHEGPKLGSLRIMSSEEGAPIPVVYGRMRVGGQVIWASNLEEVSTTTTDKTSAKGGPKNTNTDYTYFANFAVGLCEGTIDGIGRVWADGKEIDLETYAPRIYLGTETQNADSFITTLEGQAPAYRGLAYIMFERFPLASFGNRLPQLAFEIIRKGNAVSDLVKAVNIIPGSTEFGYDTEIVSSKISKGVTATENAHISAERSDWSLSMDQLQASCENVDAISLVVAWFGNDLRCGQCQIKPGVDNALKNTSPVTWTVNGIDRPSAYQISTIGGSVAFGGTPADASVIRAIQDAHARGLKVTFYPFILMDITSTNSLPDPYGGSQQSPYPWRGRITVSGAAINKSGAAATQIASFVGTAQPSHFTPASETITYSGPVEWSFRRMTLHYAKLCALAGGVDAFLIGSELVGLTTTRSSASNYPFVGALQSLAAEVKLILPAAKISYAADWSEYFGHHPNDGSNDVYFHLDPLWASPAIDFVGIDNYLPLSDWRDGSAHLDYSSAKNSIYEQTYLQSGMASGEYYDWYYASPAARNAQTRSPISDGTYGKPWVFRPKDFKNWWSNAHYDRPAGVQISTPTAWVPQSKPIWFTEAGCPAIDKATNQPNVFYDAKSSESALPYYSGGQQDVQIQLAYVQAFQNYWSTSGAQNPVSNIYNAPMVDPSRIFYWAWDARPFPAFPTLTDVWSDGDNYARGHWLNGRINTVELAHLITQLSARFGFNEIDVSRVEGLIDGYVLDRPMSARDALENLLFTFAIDAVESDGALKFRSRRTSSDIDFSSDDLVEDGADKVVFSVTRAQETELPFAIRLGYVDAGLDYRTAAVSQLKLNTGSAREVSLSLPASVSQAQAQARVDVALEDAWAARQNALFTISPQFSNLEPGDVLKINAERWRIKSITDGEVRKIEAVAHDPSVYEPPPAASRLNAAPLPPIYGPPDSTMMNLAFVSAEKSAAPWLAAHATPWPGSLALYKKTGSSSFSFNRLVTQQATIATTLQSFPAGFPHRIDNRFTLDVLMRYGAFTSIGKDELLNGGNLVAVGSETTGFEILQFQTAELVAENTYRLSSFLRGQAGSEPEMLASRASGENMILLNVSVVQPDLPVIESGLTATWRLGPAQLDHGHPSYLEFTFAGSQISLRPLKPTQLKSETGTAGIQMNWIRRSRIDGDSWDVAEIPLGEENELYKLSILDGTTLKRSVTITSPSYLYANANIIADFGLMPSTLTLRVAQLSPAYGVGATLERTLNV